MNKPQLQLTSPPVLAAVNTLLQPPALFRSGYNPPRCSISKLRRGPCLLNFKPQLLSERLCQSQVGLALLQVAPQTPSQITG
jgi:hypothetical protein